MSVRQYSAEQLLHLRHSPLVKKPEDLPAIEQWIEYVYTDKDSNEKLRIPRSSQQPQSAEQRQPSQQQEKRQAGNNGNGNSGREKRIDGEATPMGAFGAGQRPSLLQTRMSSKTGAEDVVLGPSKTSFTSSRNISRFSEGADKAIDGEETDSAQRRWPPNRKTAVANEVEGRSHGKESWTTARERRARENDEPGTEGRERNGRYSKRDNTEEDGERPRRGFGFGKDPRWGNNDDSKPQNSDRRGGWREREKEKRETGWDRGTRVEKEPEWMDAPAVPSKETEINDPGFMSHSHEEFQRWKEQMKASKSGSIEEKPAQTPEPPTPVRETAPPKPSTPLVLEGLNSQPFGGWGEGRRAEDAPPGLPTPKAATGKGKASRFGGFFAQQAPKEEPQPEPQQPETNIQQAANAMANGSSEDKEGFQRILQMLGGANISKPTAPPGSAAPAIPSDPASPAPKSAANGSRKQSRFFGGDQKPMSPQQQRSPKGAPFPFQNLEGSRKDGPAMEEPRALLESRFPPMMQDQQRSSTVTSADMFSPPSSSNHEQRPSSSRFPEHLQSPPSRGAATPEMSIQDLIAQQNRRPPQVDKNGDFLLSLLNSKQSKPQPQRPPPEDFQLWRDHPPETHAPQPRAPPPPGFFDDQLLRNEMPRQDSQSMMGNQMPQRRTSQRAAPQSGPPPGFFDENLFLQQQQQQQQQQQRRSSNFPDQQQQQLPRTLPGQNPSANRRMSAHPGQQQGQPPLPPPPPGMHPQFLTSESNTGNFPQAPLPPPPGFNPHMRHPPGFGGGGGGPGLFQQPQHQVPAGGFAGMGMGPQQATSPPGVNAPPGFFGPGMGAGAGPPPGFMPLRSPESMGIGGPPGAGGPGGASGGGRGGFGYGAEGLSRR
ncbi:hypothetical protein MBLNU230_g3020t1 [Neophaeotheca triangularis]